MKAFIKNLTTGCLSLIIMIGANSAMAYESPRPDLCHLAGYTLKLNGYSENAIYSSSAIWRLLQNMHVVPSVLHIYGNHVPYQIPYLATNPGKYHITHSCYVDHELAHVSLHLDPLPGTNPYFTTISWEMSR